MATENSEGPEATGPSDVQEAGTGAAGAGPKRRRLDRSGLVIAGATAAACAGLALYGVFTTTGSAPAPKATPSAEVTYEVTGSGTVDISYRALGASGADAAATASGVRLPWKKTVDVPLGKDPVVSIVLDEQGGRARCALAIRGKHLQSSTASGEFGRATCTGELPAPE
ncbi:hypothetical protein QMZ92_26500 [Streptomyces sp. HNM0645]|uniref:hypothetical protein n=1 Tax=Streptomyces sp. HNM0645 TaxID=2782343 RepID=UPI0024B6473D|nr:hypothetical protein [Streptomyces sp. HNM0645]MDI9887824.1 hypothetical protein [Streptomyces sp. HNM0645]